MAAGVGITLTAASTVVFAELHWTPGILVQAEDRAHRIGQKSSVNIHYLIAKETVDDIIWPSVSHKVQIVSTMCDGRKHKLVASFASASDAVELAGKHNLDDTSSLDAMVGASLELEHAGPTSDNATSSACEAGTAAPSGWLARLQRKATHSDEVSRSCSFHVSKETGRMHVLDITGRPLGQGASFKLADWEALWESGALPQPLLIDPAAARATEAFLCQWLTLRSGEQRELMNRVVTLPLSKHLRKQQTAAAARVSAASVTRGRNILSALHAKKKLKVAPEVASVRILCSWCKEADPEDGSLYCSPDCEAKGEKTGDVSFGKAFAGKLLAAVNDGGPYKADIGEATLEVYANADKSKSGSKLPVRHCQWNDGWDIRTLVVFEGKEMSFKALKEKLDSTAYENAEIKMGELKDRIKTSAVQAVQAAKAAAVQSILQNDSQALHPQQASKSFGEAPAEELPQGKNEQGRESDVAPRKSTIVDVFAQLAFRKIGTQVSNEAGAVDQLDNLEECATAVKQARIDSHEGSAGRVCPRHGLEQGTTALDDGGKFVDLT